MNSKKLHGRRPRKVLMVDDHEEMLSMYTCLLKVHHPGWKIRAEKSSQAAMPHFEKQKWDLLITDMMRGGNYEGKELICWVKEHHPSIKVLLITASPLSEEKWRSMGADFFLQKPFHIEDFTKTFNLIEQCLG